MNHGVYYGVSWEEYLGIDAMNPSTLKHGCKSMKRLRRAIDGECQPDPKAVAVGNAVHTILAGEFEDRYFVMPDFHLDPENETKAGKPSESKSTEYCKAQMELYLTEHDGKEQVSSVQVATASKVANEVRKCSGALIDRSQQEVVVVGEIEGVPFKTRLDGLTKDQTEVWDIKTTTDVSDQAFFRIFDRLGYGFSAAVHIELLRQNSIDISRYTIIAAEVGDDYDVRKIDVPIQLMENAIGKVREVAKAYSVAMETNCWPGIGDGPLAVSNWVMEKWETEDDLQWAQ